MHSGTIAIDRVQAKLWSSTTIKCANNFHTNSSDKKINAFIIIIMIAITELCNSELSVKCLSFIYKHAQIVSHQYNYDSAS